MVKTPTFDKNGVKKGAWSEDEDNKLRAYVQRYGHWNWRLLPKFAGLSRSGKSCRLRWVNYLRPDIKHGNFTKEEEDLVVELHKKLGNKWSEIAAYLPGRSDNEIKNRWHTHLKKRTTKNQDELANEQVPQVIDNPTENPIPNSKELEFQQDLENLLAESPLSSSSTNLTSNWFSSLDSASCSSDNIPQLVNNYPNNNYSSETESFWAELFLSAENDSITSLGDNLCIPSDIECPFSSQEMFVDDELLWSSSMDSYGEYNGQFFS